MLKEVVNIWLNYVVSLVSKFRCTLIIIGIKKYQLINVQRSRNAWRIISTLGKIKHNSAIRSKVYRRLVSNYLPLIVITDIVIQQGT